jgi:hypothetical protein
MMSREERILKTLNILVENGSDGERQGAQHAIDRIQSKTSQKPIRKNEKRSHVRIKYEDSNHKELLLHSILKVIPGAKLEQADHGKYILAHLTRKEAEAVRVLSDHFWRAFQREASLLLTAFVIKNELITDCVSDEPMSEDVLNDIPEVISYYKNLQSARKRLNGWNEYPSAHE